METPPTPAERRATNLVVALFLSLATVFILDSTWELAKGAFDLDRDDTVGKSPEALRCYGEVRRLEAEIDRAVGEASRAGLEAGHEAYEKALAESFSEGALASLESTCRSAPRGTAAYGALLRIRRAEESAIAQRTAELRPLRDDLHRALPAP